MFPTVMLVVNVSSVAVLWFGGHRIDDGQMQVGALTAFLSLPDADPDVGDDGDVHADDDPARRRSAPSGSSRCSTPSRRSCRRPTPVTELRRHGDARAARRRVPLPGRRARRCCATSRFTRPARADHRDHRQHRRGQDHAAQPRARGCSTSPPARCSSTASTCASSTPSVLWSRIGLVPQKAVPVLRHRREQPALRQARTPPTRSCGQALRDRPGRATSSRRCPSGLDAPIAQGGTNVSGGQRQRLAIARALVRRPEIYLFDDSFSALDLATDARLRAALRPVTARRRRGHRRPAGLHHRRRRPDPRARGRRGRRAAARHDELLETCPTYAGDRRVPADARRRRHEPTDADRRPPSGDRRTGRPGGATDRRRHAGREVDDFGRRPSGCGAGCGPTARSTASIALAVRQRALERRSARDPRARHRPDLRRRDRRAAARPASRRRRRSTACGRGDDSVADMLVGMDVVPGQGIDFAALRRTLLLVARRSTSRRRCSRGCRATCSTASCSAPMLPAARRRRGQAQPAAAALLRPAAARRAAQPGHQRHRQHRQTPAADAEPAAHLAAHRRRRAGDDVLDLAAAGAHRAGHGPAVAGRHRRRSPSARSGMFVAQWRHTGALNAQIEETYTGHALVKVFGRQREVEAALRATTNDELYEASFGAQFISGHRSCRR